MAYGWDRRWHKGLTQPSGTTAGRGEGTGAPVSDDIFETMAVGIIGRFWPLVDGRPQVPVMHGAVRRDEDGYWVVDVEGWDSAGDGSTPERGYPESMVAILGGGPVYFSDQRRRMDFQLYTDRKIHVNRLWFRTATTGARQHDRGRWHHPG
jgi:hypothetical protein